MASSIQPYSNWLNDLFSLFLPRRCAACDDPLMQAERSLCLPCLSDLPHTRFHGIERNPVEQLFLGKVQVEAASALLRFERTGVVQHILHRLKYQGDKEVGLELGGLMAQELMACQRFSGLDSILAVPLHPARLRTRGFNQAQVVVDGFREHWPLDPTDTEVVRMVRTHTQTRKGRYDRWTNVKEAFQLEHPERLRGRHVLLVDDVITTGATIEGCIRALLKAPDLRVSVMALAVA